ncbi:MAG TPA: ABC transporter substrate-binding protein [Actinomycetota bacterium]|nr:ABC transporter substrate-binding protein [Actinomycetota bacterium]
MRRTGAAVVCLALFLTGCGGGSSDTSARPTPSPDDGFPVTIDAAAGSVVIERRPERIVSLSPTATEMLFAIGAGDQVVAVDDQSDYPPEAPTTELSGFEPNVEAIASYEPDLVVASDGGALRSLRDLGIPLLVEPAAADLDDAYAQFLQLGDATGHAAEAEAEVERIRDRIDEIVAGIPESDSPPAYYHELDETYFTVTSDTFIGQVYALAGLRNIADEADKAGTGYPQLSAEYVIDADPDYIFLADSECCGQTPERVARRPGWDRIAAVQRQAVFDVGDDVSSRWGPRVVDFLEIVVEARQSVEGAAR